MVDESEYSLKRREAMLIACKLRVRWKERLGTQVKECEEEKSRRKVAGLR